MYKYLCHTKVICRMFCIIAAFTLLFELCTPEICGMLLYKYTETLEYVKNCLLFKKDTNFTGK